MRACNGAGCRVVHARALGGSAHRATAGAGRCPTARATARGHLGRQRPVHGGGPHQPASPPPGPPTPTHAAPPLLRVQQRHVRPPEGVAQRVGLRGAPAQHAQQGGGRQRLVGLRQPRGGGGKGPEAGGCYEGGLGPGAGCGRMAHAAGCCRCSAVLAASAAGVWRRAGTGGTAPRAACGGWGFTLLSGSPAVLVLPAGAEWWAWPQKAEAGSKVELTSQHRPAPRPPLPPLPHPLCGRGRGRRGAVQQQHRDVVVEGAAGGGPRVGSEGHLNAVSQWSCAGVREYGRGAKGSGGMTHMEVGPRLEAGVSAIQAMDFTFCMCNAHASRTTKGWPAALPYGRARSNGHPTHVPSPSLLTLPFPLPPLPGPSPRLVVRVHSGGGGHQVSAHPPPGAAQPHQRRQGGQPPAASSSSGSSSSRAAGGRQSLHAQRDAGVGGAAHVGGHAWGGGRGAQVGARSKE